MADGPPLHHLRIVECAGWNGVFAGRIFADAGADVVRIVPTAGDPLDAEPPFAGESGLSLQATFYNVGKRVVALDLDTPEGRARFLALVAAADMLIEDWTPGAEPIGTGALLAAAPRLVRVSVTPFGRTAPQQWATNDLVANALSGAASVTGNAETPPLTGWGNQTAHTSGLYAAAFALASLRAARATGEAQHVDMSVHEALVSCTEQVLMEWFLRGPWGPAGTIAPRQGALHWSGAYEIYPGATGQGVMVSVALRFLETVLPWLVEDGMAEDLDDRERYPNVLAVVRDLPHVMDVVRKWVATKDPTELFFDAQRRHLSWGPVWSIEEALASPQLAAREWFANIDVPGAGSIPLPGRPIRTDADGPHPVAPRRVEPADIDWEPRGTEPASGGPTATAPLAGVRVLDFTHVLAGPFGTRVLADLGADVIKVSSALRAGGANGPGHPYYACWNRNKRSVNIDMGQEEGRALARQLAARADVIIENFSAGVLTRWGIDRDALADVNPGVTVISMNGMGRTGPWRDFVTFAPTIHALVGLTYLTNPPGRYDLGYGFSLTDHLSGLAGAVASLEGLEHRHRTGRGLDIDLAQYELGLAIMGPTHMDALVNGTHHEPVGNRHPFGAWAPHGIYPAAGDDRWVAIAVRDDAWWRALCEVMEKPDLAADPRFATHAARVVNQDALDAAVAQWTANLDRYDVAARCQAAGIAAGPVQAADDLTERDENLRALGFFGTATPAEGWGAYGVDRVPALFNGERPSVYEGIHQLGEDTFDVLTGLLGLDDGEVARLMADGVLS